MHRWSLRVRSLRARLAEHPCLCLTFDDGPGACLTPRVLDLLRDHGAPATFFLLGTRAVEAPDIVARISADGHEIGCHTQRHRHAWKTSPRTALRDIAEGYDTLAGWIPPDGLFRPPYGKLTPLTWLALRKRGAPIGWWTVDSGDTWPVMRTPQSVREQVSRSGGGVVLLHDFDRSSPDADRRGSFVLATTELLLDAAVREGMPVTRLGDLMGVRGGRAGGHAAS